MHNSCINKPQVSRYTFLGLTYTETFMMGLRESLERFHGFRKAVANLFSNAWTK